ncbi:kinase-like protein [Trichoderma ceciliae]
METEEDDEVIYSLSGRKIARISDTMVQKSGSNLRDHEARTMQFIAANTTIPVPTVHEVDQEDGRVTSIVMDYVPGKSLDEAWGDLTPEQKLSTARQLRGYVSQLRSLKGDYIGALDGGKAVIGRRVTLECGPFASERLFNGFLLEDIVGTAPKLMRHYARHSLSDNHEIVFTHGDFAPRNILVDEEGRVTAILDWEEAGWYPEYWEYIKAFEHLQPMLDWPDYLARILPPKYEREYIGMCFLRPLLYH